VEKGLNFKLWLLVFSFSLLPFNIASANKLPTADDINSLAEETKRITDTFMRQSFELRMMYEYKGQFLNPDDRDKLHNLAKSVSNSLRAIAEEQQKLKKQIEDYQGNDWDDRYGSTGLWRKLSGDIYATELAKCEIDYYSCLTVDWSPLQTTLQQLREQIISLDSAHSSVYSQLLRAKIIALAKADSAWPILANDILNSLTQKPDINDTVYFRAALEKIKLTNLGKQELITSLAEELAQSNCSNDLELVLPLIFEQRRHNPNNFKQIVNRFPQTEAFLGKLILSDITCRFEQKQSLEQTIHQISVFEAELAAQAAWKNETTKYEMHLEHLAGIEKFQTPLILYVTAAAFADSQPTKAVNLLIKASKLQQQQRSDKLNIESLEIAEQAVKLAYNLFIQQEDICPPVLEAFENYYAPAEGKIDEELEYLYSIVLSDCGQKEKSKKLLQKIANRPQGNWRNRARLDLILQAIQQNKSKPADKTPILTNLSDLITDCTDPKEQQTKIEAITIYCQLLLETKNEDSAQKVLNILTEAQTTCDTKLNIFKSKALQQLGRLDESANCLLIAVEPDHCEHTGQAMELLSEITNEIDGMQQKLKNFSETMQNCKRLAQICYGCLDGMEKQQAGLLLVETAVFSAAKNPEELSKIEKLLDNLAKYSTADDVNLLRCRARLLTEQGNFNQASALWAKICQIQKAQLPSANQQSWKWWQAKFYELYCWSKCADTQKEDVLHTIEVLENSFSNIPPLWAEKLNLLKDKQFPQ